MNGSPIYHNCKSYIECQFLDTSIEDSGSGRPFVTISRQTGVGGTTISRHLSAFLRDYFKSARCQCPWTVFDKDLIGHVLKEQGLPEKLESYFSENKASEIEDTIEELFGLHPARWVIVRKTSETVLRLASRGWVILIGRGANLITRHLPTGFHVRLVGSYEKRWEHARDYYRLTREQAQQRVRDDDQARKKYFKKYFNRNIDDPLLYDMVLNTDLTPYEEAAQIIGRAALSRFKALPAA